MKTPPHGAVRGIRVAHPELSIARPRKHSIRGSHDHPAQRGSALSCPGFPLTRPLGTSPLCHRPVHQPALGPSPRPWTLPHVPVHSWATVNLRTTGPPPPPGLHSQPAQTPLPRADPTGKPLLSPHQRTPQPDAVPGSVDTAGNQKDTTPLLVELTSWGARRDTNHPTVTRVNTG